MEPPESGSKYSKSGMGVDMGAFKKGGSPQNPFEQEERIYNIHTDEIKSRLEDIF